MGNFDAKYIKTKNMQVRNIKSLGKMLGQQSPAFMSSMIESKTKRNIKK